MDLSRYITHDPLDLDSLLRETETVAAGGLVVFAGTVRDLNDGRAVSGMTYEAHERIAAKTLAEIESEALRDFDVLTVRVQHRIGVQTLGETSVLVVVRAAHRGAAFDAARYAIDELKERVAIWKEEHYVEGDSAYLDGTVLKP